MKEPELKSPWWVLPSGRIQPLWWLAVAPVLVWSDYVAGPETPFPSVYVLPVCVAAWYSGQWPAVALAVGAPLVHLTFVLTLWHSQAALSGLVAAALLRAAVVSFIALVFARQSERERELRRDLQRRHAAQLSAEQLRVVQVTMRTVQDIVNNCLNQLQLLRLDAEGRVPEESLQLFDQAIHEASAQLRALADMEAFREKEMEIGTGVDTRR